MMTDPLNRIPRAAIAAGPEPAHDDGAGLVPQARMMIHALWVSAVRNALIALAVAIFLVIVATACGQILLNKWNQPFYDALSHRDLPQFLHQLGVFGLLAGALLFLNVLQRWLGEMSKVKMREGLMQDLVKNWLMPGRAFRLAHAGSIGVNPDQRMHEDARHLTELSADLSIGLLQASILLITFVDILWAISSQFEFHIAGREIAIPGYMVWAAILYSASASLLSYRVGRGLVGRNAEHYAREADLRYTLVRVNEHIDVISLAGGEADEARHIALDLAAVLAAMRRIVYGVTNLTWVTAGYGWFTIIAPIVAAAPLYFSGRISFGGLMLASGAFMQVQSSLRWFVDNFSAIADWRATLLRVASFRRAMLGSDEPQAIEDRIAFSEGLAGSIGIEDLTVISSTGCSKLAEGNVAIKAGEHVLIVGESGSGKTLLFRALAGLWQWGTGRIVRPRGEDIVYMPQTPYLPPGTLREVLAYPLSVEHFSAPAFQAALERLGLYRLVPLLDAVRRWDPELRQEEQQGVAFARILLRMPSWVVIDDALGTLGTAMHERIASIFATELVHTGVIHIGRADACATLFTRTLHLVKEPAAAAPSTGRSRDAG
ncbi:MAG: ABC transporter ATP-binding protein/permease [Steroidobacterales bacterium]